MKNIFKKIILLYFCIITVSYVSAQKRKNPSEVNSSVVYVLPRTVIDVTLVAQKNIYKRGPFYNYAEKYLGIKKIINNDTENWEIKKMDFSQHAEIDPSKSFELLSNENYQANLISLSPEGLIKGFNLKNSNSIIDLKTSVNLDQPEPELSEYGQFAVDRILKFSKDTTYKVVETDSSFIKVPVLETSVSAKSQEDKAADAAHTIFKLRKRRFKMLTANYDILPPDGKSYEIIVRELEKLENEYLSLFVGKRFSKLKVFNFSYTPKERQTSGVMFKFSENKGPQDASSSIGRSVKINIDVKRIAYDSSDQDTKKNIFYRIPAQAQVLIYLDSKVFLNKNMTIAQLGGIGSYPVDILINEGYSVDYHTNYGSIKRVYLNK